jgi:hypothetical protein
MVVLNSENARLVTFGSCNPGEPKEINAFSFALSDGSFVFVVPKELVQTFPGFQPRPIDSFDHIDDIQNLLPEVVAKSATFNQEFVMLNLRTMDYFILAYANARLGKFFAADQMPAAIDRLYEKNKEQQASYFGITAASSLLVRFGPLVYFALSFELWRRLRLLPVRKIRSTEYWFVFETRDWIGYIYAILCAVAPVLFGILIYVLFAVAQDLSVFGHIVTLGGIIRLDFPQAPPSGWIGYDNISSIVELVGVPFHFIVLTLISTKLMRLIRANRAQV